MPINDSPSDVIDLNDSQLLDLLDREVNAHNLRWLASNTEHPGIGTVSGAERHGIRDAMRALLVLLRGSAYRDVGLADLQPQGSVK